MNVTIHDVSIICVTETWFKHYMDDNNLSIEGFSIERKDRCDGGTGGGVACYIRNSFMYIRLRGRVVKDVGHLDHVRSYGVREVVSSIPDRGNIVG